MHYINIGVKKTSGSIKNCSVEKIDVSVLAGGLECSYREYNCNVPSSVSQVRLQRWHAQAS